MLEPVLLSADGGGGVRGGGYNVIDQAESITFEIERSYLCGDEVAALELVEAR